MILHTWVGSGGGASTTTLSVSPAGGYYEGGTTVTLTATGENEPVYIYYTLDGTTPTINSTRVSSGSTITITQNKTTLKAIAIDSEGIESSIVSYVYYTEAPTGITVRFKKPDEWNAVYFYAWNDVSTTILGPWPGTQITSDASGWYSYLFEGMQSVNLVFNNGSGSQTVDVTGISSDICYKTNGTSNGKYLVVSSDCSSTSVNNYEKYSFIVSPNPVKNRLSVLSEKPFTKVELISASGSVMKIFENKQTLEMSNVPAGMYFIKVYFLDHTFAVKKIIKL